MLQTSNSVFSKVDKMELEHYSIQPALCSGFVHALSDTSLLLQPLKTARGLKFNFDYGVLARQQNGTDKLLRMPVPLPSAYAKHRFSMDATRIIGMYNNVFGFSICAYMYTHGKKLRNTSSLFLSFKKFQLPVDWRH